MDSSGTLHKTEDKMDYKNNDRDRDPRTRTETKKQGKKGKGSSPYSAKHVRMTEKLASLGSKLKKSAEVDRGR
jgi:hypothetical protein